MSTPDDKGLEGLEGATTSTPSPRRRLLQQLQERDPSTLPFLRAYALGYAASVGPSILRLLLGLILGKKGRAGGSKPIGTIVKELVLALAKGLSPRGVAMAFGVSVGGAKWGESRVQGAVEVAVRSFKKRVEARRRRLGVKAEAEVDPAVVEEREAKIVKTLSTWLSATIGSLVSITLLQSSTAYRYPRSGGAASTELDVGVSPYPSLNINAEVPRPLRKRLLVTQSPTLDLTLFVLVRATDSLVRGIWEYTGIADGRAGSTVAFIANQADTIVFQLSCWRIMWAWFYRPELLPPSYNKWIATLARMDPRLLHLLQFARRGEYVYGQEPPDHVKRMCEKIASRVGREPEFVNPYYLDRLDCSVVHGKVGAGTCEVNAIKRWLWAFRDCLAIYLPVHFVPVLLFGFSKLVSRPLVVLPRVLLGASRSAAFLATFVATIYASVCLVRTRLASVLPFIPQQVWDSGACAGLGCFLCGFSVLIENKRRRREMALYCAPRALYAMMDDFVPSFLVRGKLGEFTARWIERSVFAFSTGTVIAATVHRPELVSGVARGIMGLAVGKWENDGGVKALPGEQENLSHEQ